MKAKRYINIMVMAATLLLCLGGCVKYDLHSTSSTGTGTGTVTITPDWTNRGAGVEVPTSWTVSLGDYTGTETGTTHTPDYTFEAGSYILMAYNSPESITVSGTTATVAQDGTTAGYISGSPGWFFTSVQEVTIVADTNNELTPTMQQQVRQLTLELTPSGSMADYIASIEGSLSGVAGTLNFSTNTHGTSSELALSFGKDDDTGNWTATVWLLGITGSTQTLTANISYSSSGGLQDATLSSDLSTALEDFNSDKTTPLSLGTTLAVVDFSSATIGDWEVNNDNTFSGEATLD